VRKCTEACRPLALLTADRQAQLCRHLFLAVSLLVSLRPWCGICCFAPKICSIAPIAPAIGARICQAITVERWRDRPGLRYQTARASDRRAGLGGSHQIFGASGFFGPGYFSTKSFDARDRGACPAWGRGAAGRLLSPPPRHSCRSRLRTKDEKRPREIAASLRDLRNSLPRRSRSPGRNPRVSSAVNGDRSE
jgi:hypothetical protein